MGCVKTITFDDFPKQSSHIGKRVSVCFHYDTSKSLSGVIVRDDIEEPGETIIKLDNEQYVRDSECQYSIIEE